MARLLRRRVVTRGEPKRGLSLQVDSQSSFSSATSSVQSSTGSGGMNTHILSSSPESHHGFPSRQTAFNESPDSTYDMDYSRRTGSTDSTKDHGPPPDTPIRNQRGSLDDMDLDTVRYVEKELGRDAVRRDHDLSPRHSTHSVH